MQAQLQEDLIKCIEDLVVIETETAFQELEITGNYFNIVLRVINEK